VVLHTKRTKRRPNASTARGYPGSVTPRRWRARSGASARPAGHARARGSSGGRPARRRRVGSSSRCPELPLGPARPRRLDVAAVIHLFSTAIVAYSKISDHELSKQDGVLNNCAALSPLAPRARTSPDRSRSSGSALAMGRGAIQSCRRCLANFVWRITNGICILYYSASELLYELVRPDRPRTAARNPPLAP
jgi:hypothetical protein